MSTDNLDIWNKLGKTDPSHTKRFQRVGGFKGTAIKPIYTELKMTEVFGPAGKGWGMGEPKFEVVPGNDGQVAVFCTVMLWWGEDIGGELGHENCVYGVGGDMVVVQQSGKLRTDDEAFKKAFTDAVGNAMKHLGMSADVHMGLFDDSKYVREREAEEAGADRQTGELPPPPKAAIPDTVQTDTGVGSAPITVGRADARPHYDAIAKALSAAETLKQLQGAWERNAPIVATLPTDWQLNLVEHKDSLKDSFLAKIAATP